MVSTTSGLIVKTNHLLCEELHLEFLWGLTRGMRTFRMEKLLKNGLGIRVGAGVESLFWTKGRVGKGREH